MSPGAGVTVSTVEQLSEIGEQAWTQLVAGHGLFASYRHLNRLEVKRGLQTRYLVASAGGRLVGALPSYRLTLEANPNAYHDPSVQFAQACGLAPDRARWFPFLLGAGRGALGGCLPIAAGVASPGDVAAALLRAFLDLAGDLPSSLMYLEEGPMRLLAPTLPAGAVIVYGLPDMQIATPWTSMEGYVESLTVQRRSAVRREIRRFARAGYTVERVPLEHVLELAPPLIANVQARHGTPPDPEGVARMLQTAVTELGDAARAITASRDGEAVAVVTLTEVDRELHGWLWGCDPERVGRHAEYFNLGYYEPLRYAIDNGLRALRLGSLATRAKALRGALPHPRYHVLFPTAGLGAVDPEQVRRHNAELLDELDRDAGDILGPPDPGAWAIPRQRYPPPAARSPAAPSAAASSVTPLSAHTSAP